jgi:hypothetical protein
MSAPPQCRGPPREDGGDVLRRHEGVVAQKPKQHLSAGAAKPASALGRERGRSDIAISAVAYRTLVSVSLPKACHRASSSARS